MPRKPIDAEAERFMDAFPNAKFIDWHDDRAAVSAVTVFLFWCILLVVALVASLHHLIAAFHHLLHLAHHAHHSLHAL